MKNADINTQIWDEDAMDRKKWRSMVHKSIAAVEQNRFKKYQAAHNRRHTPTTDATVAVDCAAHTLDLWCINAPAALSRSSVNTACDGLPMID